MRYLLSGSPGNDLLVEIQAEMRTSQLLSKGECGSSKNGVQRAGKLYFFSLFAAMRKKYQFCHDFVPFSRGNFPQFLFVTQCTLQSSLFPFDPTMMKIRGA